VWRGVWRKTSAEMGNIQEPPGAHEPRPDFLAFYGRTPLAESLLPIAKRKV